MQEERGTQNKTSSACCSALRSSLLCLSLSLCVSSLLLCGLEVTGRLVGALALAAGRREQWSAVGRHSQWPDFTATLTAAQCDNELLIASLLVEHKRA